MLELFRAGGFGMWVLLGLGVFTLVTSALFARSPDERRYALLRALSVATALSAVTALATNVIAVMYTVARNAPRFEGRVALVVMEGLGESLTPIVLGGAILTVVWFVAAFGVRRLAERLVAQGGGA
jgi:hypothetical protein